MFCRSKITNIAENPHYLEEKFYGHGRKTLTEDMVCFLQAAMAYIEYYKSANMHMPWKSQQLEKKGDPELTKYETRLQKYLDRMFEVVQCKAKKYSSMTEDAIFKELDKVIACQVNIDA